MKEKTLQKLLTAVEKTSILQQSKDIGIPYATLYRIVHEQSGGNMDTWEKIEAYYLKRK